MNKCYSFCLALNYSFGESDTAFLVSRINHCQLVIGNLSGYH